MMDSGYDWSEPLLRHRAAGYTRAADGLVNAKFLDMQQPYSAGSLYSSAEDLLKWDQALYTDRVLPAPARTAMFTPFKDNYAYGWAVQPARQIPSGTCRSATGAVSTASRRRSSACPTTG